MRILETAADAQATETILRRMAVSFDPVLAQHKELKPFGSEKRVCHQLVVNTIRGRRNLDDVIWLYGDGDRVYHSCLSHNAICLIGGSYSKGSRDRWLATDGFSTDMGVLETMHYSTVRQWVAKYFTQSPL